MLKIKGNYFTYQHSKYSKVNYEKIIIYSKDDIKPFTVPQSDYLAWIVFYGI